MSAGCSPQYLQQLMCKTHQALLQLRYLAVQWQHLSVLHCRFKQTCRVRGKVTFDARGQLMQNDWLPTRVEADSPVF